MPVTKTIVCLANSYKHGERCVAGVEWDDYHPGAWIRPVSTRGGHGISLAERRLLDGSEPAHLDVLEISLTSPAPHTFQTENWRLDPRRRWKKVGDWPWSDLSHLKDEPASLWGTGDSSGKGMNDRVSEERTQAFKSSIVLVEAESPRLHVLDGGFMEVRREVRAIFKYCGDTYNLKVTDPAYVTRYLEENDGVYRLRDCFMTISLAEPFQGSCYKVVAAVLEPPGHGGRG